MEPLTPYRVAWHKPKPVNVRPESRAAILNALEYEVPTTRGRLLGLTDLGSVTVRRACHQLLREQVLTLQYGHDPDSGQSCDLITLARYPVLPVLELAETYMIWRLCDTGGGSVFATVRDRGGFYTPEDDLNTLMGQVNTIIHAGTCGLPAAVPLQRPVLVLPSHAGSSSMLRRQTIPTEHDHMITLVRRVLDADPCFILTREEATAHELCFHSATQGCACILHIHIGVTDDATVFIREITGDKRSRFVAAPYLEGVSDELYRHTHGTIPHSSSWWKQVADFIRTLGRFLSLDCVVIESDKPMQPVSEIRAALPTSTALVFHTYALNTPSLAHRGALRFSRRILWESMRSEAPNS